ncbi:MAG TPA: DNA-directed RNA polymerase subunit alpha C-terminal domain-containing protein, partial [Oscillatoriaceae cyanobacterium]
DRFDGAALMKREWARIFEALERPSPGHEAAPTQDGDKRQPWLDALKTVPASTALAKLGLNARLLNAAERLGAHTLGDLLALPKGRLVQAPGIGTRTLRELREIVETVNEQRAIADEVPVEATSDPTRWPVDKLAKQAISVKLDTDVLANLRAALGLDPRVKEPFPTLRDAADDIGARRAALSEALEEAAARWEKASWMAAVRDEVAAVVTQLGGIAAVDELGRALLGRRGSAATGSTREREVSAVIAAAVEVEANREVPRFALYRSHRPWIVLTEGADERMAFAARLGERADALAAQDPLPSPARVADELRDVPTPPDEAPWPAERLLAVACLAGSRAAVSSRMEIYPVGMPAARALRLAAGALIGPSELNAVEIRRRVASRYPDAEQLPDGAILASLLLEAGLGWSYDPAAGVFRAPVIGTEASTASTTSFMERGRGDSLDTREFDARLRRVAPENRFLVTTMAPKYVDPAAMAIAERLGFEIADLDALYLAALKAEAAEMEVDWPFILEADGAAADTEDHRNLRLLAGAAADRLVATLVMRERPMVLRYPGLLARYGCLDRLDAFAGACRSRQAPGAVLLVGQPDSRTLPHVDRVALPIAEAGDWIAFVPAWLSVEALAVASG